MSEPQFHVCATRQEHNFKEIRTKRREIKGCWHFFKACTRCPALLETVVTHVTKGDGDVVPVAKSYLLTPGVDEAQLLAEAS